MTSSATHHAVAGPDLVAEVERLRTMLDKLPACLMRVGADATVLAVSDAALTLIGARELGQVLDTNFTERLDAETAAGTWAEFVERVSAGGSGSAECDMIDLAGVSRAVIMLGVALPNHPDGRSSLLVTVRDISTARRLEASLHEQEQLRRAVQEGLDCATTELKQLRAQLQEGADQRQQVGVAFEQLTRALAAAINAAALARQALEKGKAT